MGCAGQHARRDGDEPMLKRFMHDQAGATSIEYALIASGISIVIVLVVQNIGTNVGASFTKVKNGLQ
jgi:pilus assembly protein Flp/PilA